MPRFFFHVEEGRRLPDEEGTDLADYRAARNEGVAVLGQMVQEDPEAFWKSGSFKLTITDAAGLDLCVLDLSVVVSPTARSLAPGG
jgi:hypothetical protein